MRRKNSKKKRSTGIIVRRLGDLPARAKENLRSVDLGSLRALGDAMARGKVKLQETANHYKINIKS